MFARMTNVSLPMALILGCLLVLEQIIEVSASSPLPIDPAAQLAFQTLSDPKVGFYGGSQLPIAGKIVVVVGDCSGCSSNKLGAFKLTAFPDERKMAVVMGEEPERELRQLISTAKLNVLRAPLNVQKDWNVVFQPRVYAFDTKGKLTYIQPHDVPFERALIIAQRVLGEPNK